MKIFEVKTKNYNGLTQPIVSIEETESYKIAGMQTAENMVYDVNVNGQSCDYLHVAADEICFMDMVNDEESAKLYLKKFGELAASVQKAWKHEDGLFIIEVSDEDAGLISELKGKHHLNLFAPTIGEL